MLDDDEEEEEEEVEASRGGDWPVVAVPAVVLVVVEYLTGWSLA